jgi:hypothetical protein
MQRTHGKVSEEAHTVERLSGDATKLNHGYVLTQPRLSSLSLPTPKQFIYHRPFPR